LIKNKWKQLKASISIIVSCEKDERFDKTYHYRTYYAFLKALGYTFVKESTNIRVKGCGMNMLFATNYNIISDLYHLGLITKEEAVIAQQKIN
jgi:hypothetical protein